jgi:alpha-ketoglutaric semialdehyde dehydrogenase
MERLVTELVQNWIDGREQPALSGATFDKVSPSTGQRLWQAARSDARDVDAAVVAATRGFVDWSALTPVRRGEILHDVALELRKNRDQVAHVVAEETGKSTKDALAETDGAIAQGVFMAGEGRRLYGQTTTSGVSNRTALTIRQPVGVAGLIISANTPIANVAWKVFPALICGNAAVLKASEDAPKTAQLFAQLAARAGLPSGALSIVHGLGREAGAPLVAHPKVDVVSFTGSTAVGREIATTAGGRLAKVFLELGGKNPFIVCDDADLDSAARWATLSAFSNAGQRCASGSRIIVFESVYEEFRDQLVARARALRVGSSDEDDLGPVISEMQLNRMISAVERARAAGAKILCGGARLDRPGSFMSPTIVEAAVPEAEISRAELFGPITNLYRVPSFDAAVQLANDSPYGLTACIHTGSVHRAFEFTRRVQAGVISVNAGTYGSEPHMPFGGVKDSGNGLREPGSAALDVYSEWKTVYFNVDPARA